MWWELLALLVVICIVILIYVLVKNVLLIVLNSAIGFFALFGFNYLFNANIAINFWSVVISAVGGIFGFVIVVGCHYLGWAF